MAVITDMDNTPPLAVVAQRMLDTLPSRDTWTQKTLMTTNGHGTGHRRCLLAARAHVAGWVGLDSSSTMVLLKRFRFDPYMLLLARIIQEQYPDRYLQDDTGPVAAVVTFNDHDLTDYNPDIRKVLEKALAEAS